jgi:hypothetical protein
VVVKANVGLVCALGFGIVGCALGPKQYRVDTAIAPDTAYGCAQRLVDSLGYTVRSSDLAGGFLRVEREYMLGNRYDVLTLALLKATDGQTEMHVTAETDGVSDSGRSPVIRSSRVMSDANLLLTRCGGSTATPAAS